MIERSMTVRYLQVELISHMSDLIEHTYSLSHLHILAIFTNDCLVIPHQVQFDQNQPEPLLRP